MKYEKSFQLITDAKHLSVDSFTVCVCVRADEFCIYQKISMNIEYRSLCINGLRFIRFITTLCT